MTFDDVLIGIVLGVAGFSLAALGYIMGWGLAEDWPKRHRRG
jgi:hypothetical protein